MADGNGEERNQRQQPVLVEHDADQEYQGQGVASERREGIGYCAAHLFDIADEARDQLAARTSVQVSEIRQQQVVEHLFLQIRYDPLPDPVHGHGLTVGREPARDEDRHHQRCRQKQDCRFVRGEHVVENGFHQDGERGRRRGDNGHQRQRQEERTALGAYVIAQEASQQNAGSGREGRHRSDGRSRRQILRRVRRMRRFPIACGDRSLEHEAAARQPPRCRRMPRPSRQSLRSGLARNRAVPPARTGEFRLAALHRNARVSAPGAGAWTPGSRSGGRGADHSR